MLIVILYYLYVGFFNFQIRIFYFLQDELKQLHDECFILFKVVNCQMRKGCEVVLLTILIS